MEFIYNLCFIKRGNEVLMLNRNRKPWMGTWNGVGGKRLKDEALIDAAVREIFEETNILLMDDDLIDKGIVTWDSYDANGNGLHLYLVELPEDFEYATPRVTDEGILDWKTISWVSDVTNLGVASNIPHFLELIINDENRYKHQCYFEGMQLIKVETNKL